MSQNLRKDGHTPPDETDESPDEDDLFDLLSNRRRRYALHYLLQRPGEQVEMSELARQVAAWELNTEPERLSYEERKRVHTSLYQYHAPKLAETGVAAYDSGRGVIHTTDAAEPLRLPIDTLGDQDEPWSRYMVVSASAVTLVAAAAGTTLPAGLAAGPVLAVAVAVVFLVVAVGFAYSRAAARRLGDDGPPPTLRE